MPTEVEQASETTQEQEKAAPTFEGWLESQDETTKGLVSEHTKNLKSALESERSQRKGLEKQLRDAARQAEAGSAAEKSLTELADKLAGQEQQASFYEVAHAAGVTNLKLAWVAAQSGDYFNKRGDFDLATFRKEYPELFKAPPPPPSNAGSGTGGKQPVATGMNDFIRGVRGRS
jgi:hypothetical protein